MRPCCWWCQFGLKQNPWTKILLKVWFSVRRKSMCLNTLLLTLSFDSSRTDKHRIIETCLFLCIWDGVWFFYFFFSSPSTCTLHWKALVCHTVQKTPPTMILIAYILSRYAMQEWSNLLMEKIPFLFFFLLFLQNNMINSYWETLQILTLDWSSCLCRAK